MPVIQDLRTRADAMRRRELERALKQLAKGDSPEAVIEHLSQALTNKFLHDPMSALREATEDAERARLQALLLALFDQPAHKAIPRTVAQQVERHITELTGITDGTRTEVLSGLEEGLEVVTGIVAKESPTAPAGGSTRRTCPSMRPVALRL